MLTLMEGLVGVVMGGVYQISKVWGLHDQYSLKHPTLRGLDNKGHPP